MATTAIRVAEELEPQKKLLQEEIKNAYLLGRDETRFQVMKEPGRRADQMSFLCHILAHIREGPVPIFLYRTDRSAKFLTELLEEFSGSIITDGYGSYHFLDSMKDVIHAGCNTHARRKFVDANKVLKNNSDTVAVLNLYAKIYKLDSDWKKSAQDLEQLKTIRAEKSKTLMYELKSHLDRLSQSVNPSCNLGKAVSYTLGEWQRITKFLDNPEIPLDNNGQKMGFVHLLLEEKTGFLLTGQAALMPALFSIRSLKEQSR